MGRSGGWSGGKGEFSLSEKEEKERCKETDELG
jgi:hypothetical protein